MHKKSPGGHYRPRFVLSKFCWNCTKPFLATRKDAAYCSPACRQAYSRAFRKDHGKGLREHRKGD